MDKLVFFATILFVKTLLITVSFSKDSIAQSGVLSATANHTLIPQATASSFKSTPPPPSDKTTPKPVTTTGPTQTVSPTRVPTQTTSPTKTTSATSFPISTTTPLILKASSAPAPNVGSTPDTSVDQDTSDQVLEGDGDNSDTTDSDLSSDTTSLDEGSDQPTSLLTQQIQKKHKQSISRSRTTPSPISSSIPRESSAPSMLQYPSLITTEQQNIISLEDKYQILKFIFLQILPF